MISSSSGVDHGAAAPPPVREYFAMRSTVLIACGAFLLEGLALAQTRMEPGRSIGTVTTQGNLIVMELNEGALGKANLFDLAGRTLRFTPDGSGYRVENAALKWDSEFGDALSSPQATLHKFAFPFSGRNWVEFSVGMTGSIAFGPPPTSGPGSPGGGFASRAGGVSIGRFDQLAEAGRTLINREPAICVFLKPRMSGTRYLKELDDRAVVTWDLTEPFGGIQDFTWVKTVNRFQAVLFRDGSIEMSYQELAAKDAIVGVYPLVAAGAEKEIAKLKGEEHPALPGNLDVRSIKLSAVDGLFLKVTLETRGPVVAEGDAALAGIMYRVHFDRPGAPGVVWTIRGMGPRGRGGRNGSGGSRYMGMGPGVRQAVEAGGNTISIEGTLPEALAGTAPIAISAEVQAPENQSATLEQFTPRAVALAGIRSPELDLSTVKKQDGPFTVAYEAFHYLALPNDRDLACTVIKALGDKFDFLAYYSDFRIDNQEAGTPSNGPLGGGVTGIGQTERGLASFCSAGRFQWGFIQPVYAGSNQMQERPPEGVTSTDRRDVTFYAKQLGERWPDGKIPPYDLAMSQIGHEMAHRWSAFVNAKVNGETIPLGPTHWQRGLHAPVAFPYQRPTEASAMGGSFWQDNFDGTFTQLDDDYYVPATGYSYLDLYLMGFIAPSEVPDFFLLRNLVPAGKDANGHPIFKADRVKVTIEDVIAAEGPRLPDVYHSQKKFNTGMVVIVEHGKKPSRELIERTNGIAERWIDYWETTTGHRSSMTTSPR